MLHERCDPVTVQLPSAEPVLPRLWRLRQNGKEAHVIEELPEVDAGHVAQEEVLSHSVLSFFAFGGARRFELFHVLNLNFRPSYVVPSSVAHGIKVVHPMFRGYTQQVCASNQPEHWAQKS